MTTHLWAIMLVIFATIIGSLGPIFLKKASTDFSFKNLLKNRNLFYGVIFYGVSTFLFIPALKGGELSVLYPLVALIYVWVSFLSIKFLNEKMNSLKWIGIILIILGVSLIGIGASFS